MMYDKNDLYLIDGLQYNLGCCHAHLVSSELVSDIRGCKLLVGNCNCKGVVRTMGTLGVKSITHF